MNQQRSNANGELGNRLETQPQPYGGSNGHKGRMVKKAPVRVLRINVIVGFVVTWWQPQGYNSSDE